MNPLQCPKCGHPTANQAVCCDACAHGLNGQHATSVAVPLPVSAGPVELPDGKLPPGLHEWERQNFDRDAFLAGLCEVEQTGGLPLKDFLHELEQGVPPSE
jgi:hypothetical protein